MLLNHFYTLLKQQSEGGKVSAAISFNKDHTIFSGHFPGHPVVPGVCMMQILREVMEIEIAHKLKISKGDNMKFLSIINPELNKDVDVAISFVQHADAYSINASLFSGSVIFFKFKGTFEKT